jgi:uncharacterized membrane protein YjfL (UPF0719 family)
MDYKLVISGVVQLVITFFLGIFSAYLALRIFGWVDNKTDIQTELNKGNTAVAVILAAFIISIMIIVRSSVDTAVTNMNMAFTGAVFSWSGFLGRFGLSLLHILISLAVSFLLIVVSITVYKGLTSKIDELNEISKNNIAVAIMLASVVLGMAVILEPAVKALLDSLVIFPPLGSTGIILPGLK